MSARSRSSAIEALTRDESPRPLYPPSIPLWMVARIMAAQLNRRKAHFPEATFEDPQWMMMLELFIAGEEGRNVSISSLCFASGVPSTTALRHIRALVAKGLFERVSHPRDRRICHVRLTRETKNQMIGYLVTVASGGFELEDTPALRAAH